MPQIINTNIASLNAQRNLNTSQSANDTALQRLSSGLRINSAKDDAAGLAISTRFDAQIRGTSVAIRNAGDGVSLAQVAEGALGAMTDSLQRIRELALQSANGTNSANERSALNAEAQQLISEISRTAETTNFNGRTLLDGSFTSQFQIGANAGETIQVSVGKVTSDSIGSSADSGISAIGTSNALGSGDLIINGSAIRASAASDDTSSTNNAVASAIAKVAAINDSTDDTGVVAEVITNVVGGASQTAAVTSGTAVINDVTINLATGGLDANADRAAVVQAINQKQDQTGVTAVDTGSAINGIRLEAADGRNIELAFTGSVTSAATGLNGGAEGAGGTFEGGYTIRSNDGGEVSVQAGTGDVDNSGLREGDYSGGVGSVSSTQRSTDAVAADTQSEIALMSATNAGTFIVGADQGTSTLGDSLVLTIDDGLAGSVTGTLALENNTEQTVTGLIADINEKIALDTGLAGRVEAYSNNGLATIRTLDHASNGVGTSSTVTVELASDFSTGLAITGFTFADAADRVGTGESGLATRASGALSGAAAGNIIGGASTDSLTITLGDGTTSGAMDLIATATDITDIDDAVAAINTAIAANTDIAGRVQASTDFAGTSIVFEQLVGANDGTDSTITLSGNFVTAAVPANGAGITALEAAAGEVVIRGAEGAGGATKSQVTLGTGGTALSATAATNDLASTASQGLVITLNGDTQLSQTIDLSTGTSAGDGATVATVLAAIRTDIAAGALAGLVDVDVTSTGALTFTNLSTPTGTSSAIAVSGTLADRITGTTNGVHTASGTAGTDLGTNTAADSLAAGDIKLNDVSIGASVASDDTASDTTATSSDAAASGIAIAAAINGSSDSTGVTASANATVVDGGSTVATADQQGRVIINNVASAVITTTGDASADRVLALNAINNIQGQTGVRAVDDGGKLSLVADDGRNISLAIDNMSATNASATTTNLQGVSIGLNATEAGIKEGDITGSDSFADIAATTYSSVRLESAGKIEVDADNNGNLELENAGFEQGSFASATSGAFISEVDISTLEGANLAIAAVDNALTTIASERASLGAIQNRFDSTISSLSVNRENLAAANSRIVDADFAVETAALSRSQVLQQAGISVLAQANARPQQVLSLLQ